MCKRLNSAMRERGRERERTENAVGLSMFRKKRKKSPENMENSENRGNGKIWPHGEWGERV